MCLFLKYVITITYSSIGYCNYYDDILNQQYISNAITIDWLFRNQLEGNNYTFIILYNS